MKNYFANLYRLIISQARYKLKCPVCGATDVKFEPLPDYYIKNLKDNGFAYSLDDFETLNHRAYSCSNCGASDRDRLYALYLMRYLDQHKGISLKVLDIAPSAPITNYLKSTDGIMLRTADLMMQDVDDSIDITNMECYSDAAFDSFICSHVLEHVPDDSKALHELYRILKPGGWGVLMVPVLHAISHIDEDPSLSDVSERWRRFAQDDHVRMYSKKGFIERIEAVGFSVCQCDQKYFGKHVFREHGVTDKSVLYVVHKAKIDKRQ